MDSTTKRSHITREASPTAVANGHLNETYVLDLYNRLWTTGGYCHTSVEQVSMGAPVLVGNSAGCVCVTSPVLGEWEDNMTSVAPGEDQRCGITSVGGVHSLACSQKQGFVPERGTNNICVGAERPCWDEVFRQRDSIQKVAEKPENRQVASLRTTLTSKELSEPETEIVNCTSLV